MPFEARKTKCAVFSLNQELYNLRGPANKKRPMISGSKIESADFISQVEVTEYYLKMNLFCSSFALNQKYRAANVFRPIAAKSGRK